MECELLDRFPGKLTKKKQNEGIGGKYWELIVGLGIPLDQLASVAISLIVFLLLVIRLGPVRGFLTAFVSLIWPLAMIWFSDEIGTITGFYRGRYIDQETHPSIIKLLGWVLFLTIIGCSLHDAYTT